MTPAQQARQIRAALATAGVTQAALAASLAVSERTVRRWVGGKQAVSVSVMMAIKNILGTP